MQDSAKIPAGEPLSRLICVESYRVDKSREGIGVDGKQLERHDHVAIRGRCRRRLDAFLCLKDPPFVFVLNFQLPGDPPVSMVSYYAFPPHLCRNLGIVSNVPAVYDMKERENSDPIISAETTKALRLFEHFCDFPKNEAERLAIWGLQEEEFEERNKIGEEDLSTAGRDVATPADSVDVIEYDDSVYSYNSSTTGIGSTSQYSGANQSRDGTGNGSKRYQKALRREEEARLKATHQNSSDAIPADLKVDEDVCRTRKAKSFFDRLRKKNTIPVATPFSECSPILELNKHNVEDTHAVTGVHQKNIQGTGPIDAIDGAIDNHSSASSLSVTSKKSGSSRVSHQSSKSSWKLPSDICWAAPQERGIFPPDDIRNARFKLTPRIVDGPWVVKATVPTQPAILGRKVVIRYFRGNGYVEADIHVGSSIIASQVVGILRGYAKNFVSQVGVTLQV